MDGHILPIKQLKGEEKEIDLSDKRLGVASAVIIAGLLKENTATESLKCVSASVEPPIADAKMRANLQSPRSIVAVSARMICKWRAQRYWQRRSRSTLGSKSSSASEAFD